MKKTLLHLASGLIFLGSIWACNRDITKPGIPNPSAVYCQEMGYKLEIRADPGGNQYGVVIFPDSTECIAWDFYRGECGQKWTYCEQHGGKIESREGECGKGVTPKGAVCVFPNGKECCEQDYLHGDCGPGG